MPLDRPDSQQALVDLTRVREVDVRQRHEASVAALVERIHKARSGIEESVSRLLDAAMELRSVCRRNHDEGSSSYVMFANSHIRLAGALSQGVRRTGSMDRILVNATRERDDAKRREEELKRRKEELKRRKEELAHGKSEFDFPIEDAFEELYGDIVDEETVTDAE